MGIVYPSDSFAVGIFTVGIIADVMLELGKGKFDFILLEGFSEFVRIKDAGCTLVKRGV